MLIIRHERKAYYVAQRLAARYRAAGDNAEFWHWAKVASEVARLSPNAEMDLSVVEAITQEEQSARRSISFCRFCPRYLKSAADGPRPGALSHRSAAQ